MRLVLAALSFLALSSVSFAAETFTDPKALVSAIYAGYQLGKPLPDPSIYYSSRLTALVAQRQTDVVAETANPVATDILPAAGPFNPFMPDTNAMLNDLAIGDPAQIGDTAVINVSYRNFDQARLLSIAMVRENGTWLVDDVASVGAEEHWLLSWALTYDPQGF